MNSKIVTGKTMMNCDEDAHRVFTKKKERKSFALKVSFIDIICVATLNYPKIKLTRNDFFKAYLVKFAFIRVGKNNRCQHFQEKSKRID